MKLTDLKIGTKMSAGFFIAVLIFALSAGCLITNMTKLGKLQDEGAVRVKEAKEINDRDSAIQEIFTLIENGLSPSLGKNGSMAEVAKIDAVAGTIREGTDKYFIDFSKASGAADKHYDKVRAEAVWTAVILSILGIIMASMVAIFR